MVLFCAATLDEVLPRLLLLLKADLFDVRTLIFTVTAERSCRTILTCYNDVIQLSETEIKWLYDRSRCDGSWTRAWLVLGQEEEDGEPCCSFGNRAGCWWRTSANRSWSDCLKFKEVIVQLDLEFVDAQRHLDELKTNNSRLERAGGCFTGDVAACC